MKKVKHFSYILYHEVHLYCILSMFLSLLGTATTKGGGDMKETEIFEKYEVDRRQPTLH